MMITMQINLCLFQRFWFWYGKYSLSPYMLYPCPGCECENAYIYMLYTLSLSINCDNIFSSNCNICIFQNSLVLEGYNFLAADL